MNNNYTWFLTVKNGLNTYLKYKNGEHMRRRAIFE